MAHMIKYSVSTNVSKHLVPVYLGWTADHLTVKGKRGLDAPQLTEDFQDGDKTTYNVLPPMKQPWPQFTILKLWLVLKVKAV